MKFTNSLLIQAIADGVASPEEHIRANADNFRWDERLGPTRVACFEQDAFLPKDGSWEALIDGYAKYYVERLEWAGRGSVTEPFGPDDDGATLRSLPDDDTELVRVVKIDPVLKTIPATFEDFSRAVDLHLSSVPDADEPPILEARAIVQEFVTNWNAYDRRPPAFVGFARDVSDELKAADFFIRLRDRFGMGKLQRPPGAAPIPVMLLRYAIKDVLRVAKRFCPADAAIRVPTVLDGNLYDYFFPAPTPLPLGRTVSLRGEFDEKKLTCELIHLPVDLKLGQITAVGLIDAPIPDLALGRVRDIHLWLLRYETDRKDFGEYMNGHEPS